MIYDDVIMRTIIELGEYQVARLTDVCAREGISRAEAIRRAVDGYTAGYAPVGTDGAFGLWRDRGEDGLAYEDRMREEWSAAEPTTPSSRGQSRARARVAKAKKGKASSTRRARR